MAVERRGSGADHERPDGECHAGRVMLPALRNNSLPNDTGRHHCGRANAFRKFHNLLSWYFNDVCGLQESKIQAFALSAPRTSNLTRGASSIIASPCADRG